MKKFRTKVYGGNLSYDEAIGEAEVDRIGCMHGCIYYCLQKINMYPVKDLVFKETVEVSEYLKERIRDTDSAVIMPFKLEGGDELFWIVGGWCYGGR